MSNTIKLKHGNNPPSSGNLDKHELGYSESNKGLYIKDGTDQVIHLNDTSKIEQDITEINTNITDINTKLENVSGIVIGSTAPENIGALWIDTTDDGSGNINGIAKYYIEGSGWIEVAATWG